MINCKHFTPKSTLSLLKANDEFSNLIYNGSDWNTVVKYLSEKLILNEEQIAEIKNYYTKKTK
jgi:hypothetical protein